MANWWIINDENLVSFPWIIDYHTVHLYWSRAYWFNLIHTVLIWKKKKTKTLQQSGIQCLLCLLSNGLQKCFKEMLLVFFCFFLSFIFLLLDQCDNFCGFETWCYWPSEQMIPTASSCILIGPKGCYELLDTQFHKTPSSRRSCFICPRGLKTNIHNKK